MKDENCPPLWREAHLEVKMPKTDNVGPLLEVEMSKKCTPLCQLARVLLLIFGDIRSLQLVPGT